MTELPNGSDFKSLQTFLKEHPTYRLYDYSQLEAWDTCARKYQYVYRLELAVPDSISATFSEKLVHPFVAKFYQTLNEKPDTSWDSPEAYDDLWYAYQEYISNLVSVEPVSAKYAVVYTLDTLKSMIDVLKHQMKGDKGLLKWVNTESVYWRVLPGIENSVWLAKPDLVLAKPDGKLVTVDIKMSLYDFHTNLSSFDRQFLSQAYAANSSYMMKLFFHIMQDTRNNIKKITLNRSIIAPEPDLMNEWLDEVRTTIKAIQDNDNSQIWPKRSPRSCWDFNHPCAFIELCNLGSGRLYMIDDWQKRSSTAYLEE